MFYLFTQMWRTAFVLMLLTFTTSVNASTPLTLEFAVKKTLQQNPQLHQFEFTRQRLLAKRDTLELNPAYHLGMELENFAGTGDTNALDRSELTVALSSVIELGDKRSSRVAVADARLNKFELEQQAQTLDILGELTSTYVLLLSTQQKLKLADEDILLTELLFDTVRKRAAQGAASDADVMRAKATLTQSKIQQESLRRRLERQKISLARFWGDTTAEFSTIEGDLFAFGKSKSFSSLYERVQQSPAMIVFASDMRLKEAGIRLAQTQNRSDLSWQFGVRHLEEVDDVGLTLGFSMPLFTKNRNRGAVSAALAERNAIEYQRNDRLLSLHDRLFTAYSQRQQFIDAHEQMKQLVIPDLEKALSITREAYNRGRLKYQDWIVAQQELLNAKRKLIEAATGALLNQTLIEQLTAEPLTN